MPNPTLDDHSGEAARHDLARTLAAVLKPQKPEPYKGDIDAEGCLNFLDSYEEYYTIVQLSQDLWVPYIVLALMGDARSWWRTSGLTLSTPWEEFRKTFLLRFTPPNAVTVARNKIFAIRQGTMSVAAYSNEFRRYKRLIPKLDEESALHAYLNGLDPATGIQVRLKVPATLDEAVFQATILHAILYPDGIPNPGYPSQTPSQGTTPENSTKDPMAMEVDNLRLEINALRRQFQGLGTLPKLTDAERKRLMARGACFKCRKDGHRASECANKNGGRQINNLSAEEGSLPESGKASSDRD
ncbi:hypothetical protein BGW38_003997 [Lunasporangiospora selenospora]|uniref:CCHC-type domain-containing protein n=1 Tax=Lunasporangiospora selenospora TaxID=979761 RepID=A0A9P6KCG0_9FUNG|nr:hypothetical protein BGW38_003997 [Lunasporangiospora selenospora]